MTHSSGASDYPPQQHNDEFPDTARTTRSHAGEALQDGKNVPSIVLCALAIVAFALALTAAGYGFAGWAIIAGIVGAVCAIVGVSWAVLERRRIKAKQGLALTDPQGH
ncbi:hypothetical protein [Nocardia callitridis]|uniref:UsfY protein n=1 Tax=Nocardia callitridis TaxID=648753 RepID=A0ABP9JZY1_9NOCA